MKVTKYPQSHLVIVKDSKKIIIDPGNFTFDQGYPIEQFQNADVYLITHLHDDHMGHNTIKELVSNKPVFANTDSMNKLKELGVEATEVKDGEEWEIVGFKIKAVDLPHVWLEETPPMPQNTGFVIDDVFFHSGDGLEINSLTVDNAALPIGHSAISNNDVFKTMRKLKAKVLIPIHYDAYKRDPQELKKQSENYNFGFDIRPLKNEESTEV
jgi:L-ascorbate metabolism protein UlaG (beta-lactamase superfamily)